MSVESGLVFILSRDGTREMVICGLTLLVSCTIKHAALYMWRQNRMHLEGAKIRRSQLRCHGATPVKHSMNGYGLEAFGCPLAVCLP